MYLIQINALNQNNVVNPRKCTFGRIEASRQEPDCFELLNFFFTPFWFGGAVLVDKSVSFE